MLIDLTKEEARVVILALRFTYTDEVTDGLDEDAKFRRAQDVAASVRLQIEQAEPAVFPAAKAARAMWFARITRAAITLATLVKKTPTC